MNPTHTHYPATFRVVPREPVEGVPADGSYAECFWLPVLHPTAYVLGRRLASIASQGEATIDASWLAGAVGILGTSTMPDGQVRTTLTRYGRSLRRLIKFDLLRFDGDDALMRTVWPRVNKGLMNDLPADVRDYEPTMWVAERSVLVPARGR